VGKENDERFEHTFVNFKADFEKYALQLISRPVRRFYGRKVALNAVL